MKLISLSCPNCGSGLEVENGLDVFYCKYCGHKIQLSGMSNAAYKARIREKELDYAERLQRNEHEQERYRLKQKAKSDRLRLLKSILTNDVIGGILGFILLFSFFGILVWLGIWD